MIDLQLRSRAKNGMPRTRSAHWDTAETAAIVCDMWDEHSCKAATARVAELGPPINALIDALRAMGALVVHSPSETLEAYADHPGRKIALAAPPCETREPVAGWRPLEPDREGSRKASGTAEFASLDLRPSARTEEDRMIMAMRSEKNTKVEKTTGNVFADLGLPHPEQELLKAKLTLQIYCLIKHRDLTQAEAGKVLGTERPHV